MKIQLKRFTNKDTNQPNWYWYDINVAKRASDDFIDKRIAVLWAIKNYGRENIVTVAPKEWSGRNRRLVKQGDRRSGVNRREEIRFERSTARRKSVGRRKEDSVHWL